MATESVGVSGSQWESVGVSGSVLVPAVCTVAIERMGNQRYTALIGRDGFNFHTTLSS